MSCLEVIHHTLFTPEQIHDWYMADNDPMLLGLDRARIWEETLGQADYQAWGGVMPRHDLDIRAAIRLHENGQRWIQAGALLGPWIIYKGTVSEQLAPGFRFYHNRE